MRDYQKNTMNTRFLSTLATLVLTVAPVTWAQTVDALYEQGQHALPAGWKALTRTETAAVFVHNDVHNAEGGKLAVWTHKELAAPEYFEKDKAYLSIRERTLVDCKAGRTGISDWVAYAGRYAAGGAIAKEKRDKEMSEAVPDSPEAKLLATVCALKPAPSRRRNQPVAKAASAASASATASVAGKSASASASTPAPPPAKKP
jgi:hypothetical protein